MQPTHRFSVNAQETFAMLSCGMRAGHQDTTYGHVPPVTGSMEKKNREPPVYAQLLCSSYRDVEGACSGDACTSMSTPICFSLRDVMPPSTCDRRSRKAQHNISHSQFAKHPGDPSALFFSCNIGVSR